MTRKHKKTADWTEGEVGIVRRLSANRSEKKKNKQSSDKVQGVPTSCR